MGGIGNGLAEIGETVARALPDPAPGAAVVTQVTIVAFMILGFLGSFLWTRIHYPQIQTRADSTVWSELRRLASTVRNTEVAVDYVASGKLKVPLKSTERIAKMGQHQLAPLDTSWPPEVRERVERFLEAEADYETDPAAGIFPDAPRAANGRRLEAKISASLRDALIISVQVQQSGGEPLVGEITFLLHPTYPDPILETPVVKGVAEETIYADGSFTVIAITDNGKTILGYDLSALPNAPKWFQET